MFGWGSTIHGELGLGGIEAETIFMPRAVEFPEASNIEQSKIECSIRITMQNVSFSLQEESVERPTCSFMRWKLHGSRYQEWSRLFLR